MRRGSPAPNRVIPATSTGSPSMTGPPQFAGSPRGVEGVVVARDEHTGHVVRQRLVEGVDADVLRLRPRHRDVPAVHMEVRRLDQRTTSPMTRDMPVWQWMSLVQTTVARSVSPAVPSPPMGPGPRRVLAGRSGQAPGQIRADARIELIVLTQHVRGRLHRFVHHPGQSTRHLRPCQGRPDEDGVGLDRPRRLQRHRQCSREDGEARRGCSRLQRLATAPHAEGPALAPALRPAAHGLRR